MGRSPVSTVEAIWLRWREKLCLPGPKYPIIFRVIRRKEEARGEEKEHAEALLELYRAELEGSYPGYVWSVECHETRPALKYLIRGERTVA